MGQKLLVTLMLAGAVMFGSCVSKGKYMRLDAKKTNYEMENKALKNRVETLEDKVKDLESTSVKYTEAKEKELKELNARLEENNKMIQELQASVKKQKELQDQLVAQSKEKLSPFIPGDAAVECSNGKICISLSEKLVFRPGSVELNDRGREAVKAISDIIASQHDFDVMVTSHTAGSSVKNSSVKDNWDLNVMRAASVVRLMTGEYGVSSQQLMAAGQAAGDSTEAGKQVSSRIDIVLSPRTDTRIVNSN